jgi:hypothetical protein
MFVQLIIGALLVVGVFALARPHVMQFLNSVPVADQYRKLFVSVSYGFVFTVLASLIFTIVGLGGYSLLSFLFVWGLLSFFEYISPNR